MEVKIEPSWREVLQGEFDSPYFAELVRFVRAAYARGTVYPPGRLIFEAFNRTPLDKVRVVVLGQDPYHEPGQAQGLAFYVPPGVRTPPSLYNIAKELAAEYPEDAAPGAPLRIPDLLSWADQGVLLLNATLTVEAGRAGSHQRRGWERFTDAAVRILCVILYLIAVILRCDRHALRFKIEHRLICSAVTEFELCSRDAVCKRQKLMPETNRHHRDAELHDLLQLSDDLRIIRRITCTV